MKQTRHQKTQQSCRKDGGGHLTTHQHILTFKERSNCLRQRGAILWMTGLSGSGKSTIAMAVEAMLVRRGRPAFVLDGDHLRQGLTRDLGFTPEDRAENQRRVAHCAALCAQAGLITLVSLISPTQKGRDQARAICHSVCPEVSFFETYISTSLDICESRDPKGLYLRARRGEISNFTGVSAPYEPPNTPDIKLDTSNPLPLLVQDVYMALLNNANFEEHKEKGLKVP